MPYNSIRYDIIVSKLMCGALVGVVNFDNFIKQVVCCKETIAAKLRVQLVVGSLCIPWYLVFEREV